MIAYIVAILISSFMILFGFFTYNKKSKEYLQVIEKYKKDLELEKEVSSRLKENLKLSVSLNKESEDSLLKITQIYQDILSCILRENPSAFNNIKRISSISNGMDSLVVSYIDSDLSYSNYDEPADLKLYVKTRELNLVCLNQYVNQIDNSITFVISQKNSPEIALRFSPEILLTLRNQEEFQQVLYDHLISFLDSVKYRAKY